MKTLCNFVSLPLRSWAVRAGQHLAKTWTTARRRQIIWNLVDKTILHLVSDKLDCEDICFLVLAGNHSWGSHPFLLFHRPCVTWGGGGALSWAAEFRCSLYSCTGAGRKSVFERNLWCTRRLALFPKTSETFLRIVPLWAGVTSAAIATRANSTCSSRL